MTVLLTTRADITLEAVARVAWQGEGVQIAPAALARIAECRQAFLQLIDSDPNIVIYGVTTGSGDRASTTLSPQERKVYARQMSGRGAASFGRLLPERVARAIVLARLANFLEGHAAVRPQLAEAVAAMLDGRPLPPVPVQGNGGAGETLAPSHLFAHLNAEIGLEEKEGMALVNGSPASAALVADVALAARNRVQLALEVFALSASGAPQRRWYQAPVSYRILPRVLGQAYRALAAAEKAATISLRSVSDNPVYIPPDAQHPLGRAFSTGGYHNAMAYPAIDGMAAAWADLCLLAERHTEKIPTEVAALPRDQLAVQADAAFTVGIFGMVQPAYWEEARHAAQRTFLARGMAVQNDVVSPTFWAWDRERVAGECLDAALAMVAMIASQALYVTGRDATPALQQLLSDVRAVFPPTAEPRQIGQAAERLTATFTRRVYATDTQAADPAAPARA